MDGPAMGGNDGADGGTGGTRPVERGIPPEGASIDPMRCVRDLLAATRTGGDTGTSLATLASYDDAALAPLHEDRAAALAFWLNLYNAGTQLLLERRPERYESPLRALRFFRADCVTVAGTTLSLDDVEHGILRGSGSAVGFGYLPRLFPSGFERRYRLDPVDPRIHFALNCGAASCPAVRHYEPDRVDDQLDLATRSYLESTVEHDETSGIVRVPRLFLWYRGDFGGGSGVREFLRAHDAVPGGAGLRVRYLPWDWSREPGKFE